MIISHHNLREIRQKNPRKIIVYAGGVFDLLHTGHVRYLKHLKSLGDIVVIAVSNDARVRQKKGRGRPVIPEQQRAEMVDAVRFVDYVFITPRQGDMGRSTTLELPLTLSPDIFATNERRWLKEKDTFTSHGIKLVIVPYQRGISTTRIVRKIALN